MTDLFEEKNISPMLLYETKPFDDENYIYELKLDGIRCIAYIDKNSVILQNKRFKDVSELYPELADMKKCVNERVILDGELVVFTDGKPDFYALQARSLMTDKFRISLAAKKNPAKFVAYDIIYYNGKDLTNLPIMKRKKYLSEHVKERCNLSISRYIEKEGIKFFELVKKEGLEGIVAKRKDGLYHIGKRTRDWVKIKVMQEEDLFICGYVSGENGEVKDLILGYYDGGKLKPRGKIFLGVSREEREIIKGFSKNNTLKKAWFPEYKDAIWLKPELTGTVRYMQETKRGGMRQPIWKGLTVN